MQTIKYLACIFLLFSSQVFPQNLTNLEKMYGTKNPISSFLDLYPLYIGNFWQYKITVDSGFNNEDTTYYANREVIKDTLAPNGFFYKTIFDTRYNVYNSYKYLRVDSSTGCIYAYFFYENEEYLIDSLKMMAGDIIFNGFGYELKCTLVDTVELFAENRFRKHFSLNLIPFYYRNKYAEGLGEVYRFDHFENIVGTDITSEITYAKIDAEQFGQLLSVPNNSTEIISFSLSQNYPNPFNPITKIKYTIPSVGTSRHGGTVSVQLKVYHVLGNEIATLINEEKPAGSYKVEFSVEQESFPVPSSGVYFYQLKVYSANGGAGSFVEPKKMVLLR